MIKDANLFKNMFSKFKILVSILFLAMYISIPNAEASVYTNKNFHLLLHEEPVYFELTSTGAFWGYTNTGREFIQKTISNENNVRIHKFIIDDAFFYITDRGEIFANSNIQAVSIYYSRAS